MRSRSASGRKTLPMKLTWMRAAFLSLVISLRSASGSPSSLSTCHSAPQKTYGDRKSSGIIPALTIPQVSTVTSHRFISFGLSLQAKRADLCLASYAHI